MVISIGSYFGYFSKPDAEWQKIIEKLWKVYGIRSTGNKALDKQKLHELELKQAEQEAAINTHFLTLTKNEIEKIQAKKKTKISVNETDIKNNSTRGAEILGKQIFIAIQIKKEQEDIDNKRKRNNKYQS